jgi:hypothetical protein
MIRPPEQYDTFYYNSVTIKVPIYYYNALEERCEHLEEIVYSTTELLQEVIKDFHSPCLVPLLGAFLERLNSIAALMETGLANAPSLEDK